MNSQSKPSIKEEKEQKIYILQVLKETRSLTTHCMIHERPRPPLPGPFRQHFLYVDSPPSAIVFNQISDLRDLLDGGQIRHSA